MVDESDDELSSDMYMSPPQLNITQKLTACPILGSLEDEWRCHNEATEAVTMYCGVLEGGPLRGRPKKTPPKPVTRNDNHYGASNKDNDIKEEEADKSSRDALFKATKKHIDTAGTGAENTDPVVLACFQCYGDEKQPDNTRCKIFHDHGCIS
jgi:hypothetical protein